MAKKKPNFVVLKPGDLIMVEWFDAAHATTAWADDINIAPCTSVGFLVKKDKKQLVIAHTKADDGDYAGRFAIPRGFIAEYKIVN